jgi:hypothetical protein
MPKKSAAKKKIILSSRWFNDADLDNKNHEKGGAKRSPFFFRNQKIKGQTFGLTPGSPKLSPCRENLGASIAYSFKAPAPWQPPAKRSFSAPFMSIKTPAMGANGQ